MPQEEALLAWKAAGVAGATWGDAREESKKGLESKENVDQLDYSRKQKDEFMDYEARCRRCGACCGANDGDPCSRLRKDEAEKYYCSVYDNRVGMQKTLSGKQFACVPIRDLRPNLPFKGCVYFE